MKADMLEVLLQLASLQRDYRALLLGGIQPEADMVQDYIKAHRRSIADIMAKEAEKRKSPEK